MTPNPRTTIDARTEAPPILITTVGASEAQVAVRQPAELTPAPRIVVTIPVAGSLRDLPWKPIAGTAAAVTGSLLLAGWVFGSTALGHMIALGIAGAACLVLLALWAATRESSPAHCPGPFHK